MYFVREAGGSMGELGDGERAELERLRARVEFIARLAAEDPAEARG